MNMNNKLSSLGNLGSKFFALMQMRRQEIVTLGELQSLLGISARQEHTLLKRLTQNGFIIRIKRGIYLVPEKIPSGGYWQPNEYYVVAQYMKIINATYYIGGMTAFNHYGLTTQIPNEITIYNDKISGLKNIGNLSLIMIKIPKYRIEGTIQIPQKNDNVVNMASLARTIIDAIQDWKKYATIPEAYDWLKEQSHDIKFTKELINLTCKFSNKATIRRIGYRLELYGASTSITKKLHKSLTSSKGWVRLDPNGNFHGKINEKWRIIDNVGQF